MIKMETGKDIKRYAIHLHEDDEVVTAFRDIPKGEYVESFSGNASVIDVQEDVKAGFKISIAEVEVGKPVHKYGYVIGAAKEKIRPGDVVHVNNLSSIF
ncbi:UxaA family hydrolase [Nanoarchaeota archaeon]